MSPASVTGDDVDEALRFAQEVIDACGARLPGSAGALKAADMLHAEMAAFDAAAKEEFSFAPEAFLGFLDLVVASFVLATLLLFCGGGAWLYCAVAVLSVGVLAWVSQFVFYWGWFDVFYWKKKGINVVGLINPANEAEVEQEIIVCGHHDSAWIVRFLLRRQKLYGVRLILGTAAVLGIYLSMIVLAIVCAASGRGPAPWLVEPVKYASLLGLFFVVPLLGYRDRKAGSFGAGDNLISSSMALQIGKILGEAKRSGNPLKRTRVRIISFDAEEAALKGSKAYVRRHRREFWRRGAPETAASAVKSVPTYALCPDCIFRLKDFKLLTSDQNGLLATPWRIVDDVRRIAERLGYRPAIVPFPFGGGATDAASFLRIGVPALPILGMDSGLIRDGLVYHTPQDRVENIDRELVEAAMKVMLAYIIARDMSN